MIRFAKSFRLPAAAVFGLALAIVGPSTGQTVQAPIVIEDFEGYAVGEMPNLWKTNKGRSLVAADLNTMTPDHEFRIGAEGTNRFARATMVDYAYRLIRMNGDGFDWRFDDHPVLSWRWRIHEAPAGAREDDRKKNDVAAAVYVLFDRDWLGRPRSIKYTYSSTLPVGTRVSYGGLKVIVVGSAKDGDLGVWTRLERDVVRDYEEVFGRPFDRSHPIGISLFSDADDVPDGRAAADFDDLVVRSQFQDRQLTKDNR
jgi:hypothetical protein